jgi:hypothetical protein
MTVNYRGFTISAFKEGGSWRASIIETGRTSSLHPNQHAAIAELKQWIDQGGR